MAGSKVKLTWLLDKDIIIEQDGAASHTGGRGARPLDAPTGAKAFEHAVGGAAGAVTRPHTKNTDFSALLNYRV